MPGNVGLPGVEEGARDGAAPKEEKEEDAAVGGCAECVAAAFCILTFMGVGALMINYGPTKLLRHLLNLIPAKPGWDWYVSMGLITMVSIVMILPIWPPMCMAAGLVFGLLPGAALNFCSILGAAICSLVLGRFVLRAPVRRWLDEGEYPTLRRIFHVLEDSESSLQFLILFRFLFLPMFVRNYGPSTLRIPLWKLSVACVPHCIWISLLFASLGSTFKDAADLIRDGKEAGFEDMKWQQLSIFCVSLLVAVCLAVYAQRKYNEELETEQASLVPEAGSEKAASGSATA